MSNQVNISERYSQDKLNELKTRLMQAKTPFSRISIERFLTAIRNKDLHRDISHELASFLGYLDSFIKTRNKTIDGHSLNQGLDEAFSRSTNPYNTMWQIRFINFISNVDMRKKIHYLETVEQKAKIAGIQQKPVADRNGQEWNISQHHSLGAQTRSLETSFYVTDDYPRATVVVERPDNNYSQIEDDELFRAISELAQETFTPEALQRVPDIQFNSNYFNQDRSNNDKVQLINTKPLSKIFSKLINRSTDDGRTLIELINNQAKLGEMIINYDSESSLLDLYLYRLNAFQDGHKIKAFHDQETGEEAFEFDFDPKNYEGKEGRKKLAIEAYEFFRTEFNESPQRFMDLVLNSSYQSEINFARLDKEFRGAVQEIPIKQTKLDLNFAIIVDLKDHLAIYSRGDTTVFPIFHQDIHSTGEVIRNLKKEQKKPNYQISRLELSDKKAKGIKNDLPAHAAIYDKDEIEAVVLASRHLIKDRRKPCSGKQNKHYADFVNNIITPYIQDSDSIQRKKDVKLITEMISHASEGEDLGIYVLSHKISDDNEESLDIPDFQMPNDGNDPWEDSPTGSPNDLVLV